MAIDYTTTARIAGLKRRGKIPTNQNLYQEADFLEMLSDEMIDEIVPTLMSVRNDYLLAKESQTIVLGQSEYDIPWRAVGDKLKDATIVDEVTEDVIEDLPFLDADAMAAHTPMDYIKLYGFAVEANKVRLFPNESAWVGRKLKLTYFRRPNRLVATTSAGKVQSINTGTNEVTLDNVPTTWTTALEYDVIKGSPAFDPRADGISISGIAGYVVTLPSLPTGLAVGDYFAEKGESPIPQIPYDAFGWLEQLGAVKAVESISNAQELQAHIGMAQKLENKFLLKITPRVDHGAKKIVPRKGIFRSTRRLTWPR